MIQVPIVLGKAGKGSTDLRRSKMCPVAQASTSQNVKTETMDLAKKYQKENNPQRSHRFKGREGSREYLTGFIADFLKLEMYVYLD